MATEQDTTCELALGQGVSIEAVAAMIKAGLTDRRVILKWPRGTALLDLPRVAGASLDLFLRRRHVIL